MKKIKIFFMLCLFGLISIAANAIPNNTIYYTSSDGNVVFPYAIYAFGDATIKSNEYSNGQGIITFDRDVTSIGDRAFENCLGLASVTIPNSVTEIDTLAFVGCSGLTSIEIPNSVTEIGFSAFSDCSGLTSVTIGNSVTSIGEAAFFHCSGLTSIEIPNSVTSIGEAAFYHCSNLTSIEIPNSVTSIGEVAFRNCSGFKSITVNWKRPLSIADYTFDGVDYDNCILYVPKGTSMLYMVAPVWNNFKNIQEIDAPDPTPELEGDANGDGVVDVADITTIASYILGNTPGLFVFENADVDKDGQITVSDITATAGIILNNAKLEQEIGE